MFFFRLISYINNTHVLGVFPFIIDHIGPPPSQQRLLPYSLRMSNGDLNDPWLDFGSIHDMLDYDSSWLNPDDLLQPHSSQYESSPPKFESLSDLTNSNHNKGFDINECAYESFFSVLI